MGENLRTDTFGRNNAHPLSKECEGALCSVTHASKRPKIEVKCLGKFSQNNALFHCNLNSKREVPFHHDIKFLLLFGNFSIAQAFLAFQRRLSRYCIPLGMRSFVYDWFWCSSATFFQEVDAHFFTARISILGEKLRDQEKIPKPALRQDIALDTTFRCVWRGKGLRAGKNGKIHGKTIGKWGLLGNFEPFRKANGNDINNGL